MDVLWLGDAGAQDPRVVGGKAANLSRFAGRFRVPPGFCLSAASTSSLDGKALHALIAEAYAVLSSRAAVDDPAVAVRSSGVDEDGASASFAGQHETYLNIVGATAIAEAVERCRSSATSPRAIAYRKERGLDVAPDIAVLVQQLVPADVAAVVFTADPTTGKRDIVINASWGLGESIVGGTVTPDVYVVSREPLAVVRRVIGDKARMTVLTANGTREVGVPSVLRSRHVLDDDGALAAARLALALEEDLGAPVDVECAFQGGDLYLLQCRPITTLRAPALQP